MYDLHIGDVGQASPEKKSGAEDGCFRDGCLIDGASVCPQNSTCLGNLDSGNVVCICDPGWRGPDCDIGKVIFYLAMPKDGIYSVNLPINLPVNIQSFKTA